MSSNWTSTGDGCGSMVVTAMAGAVMAAVAVPPAGAAARGVCAGAAATATAVGATAAGMARWARNAPIASGPKAAVSASIFSWSPLASMPGISAWSS